MLALVKYFVNIVTRKSQTQNIKYFDFDRLSYYRNIYTLDDRETEASMAPWPTRILSGCYWHTVRGDLGKHPQRCVLG